MTREYQTAAQRTLLLWNLAERRFWQVQCQCPVRNAHGTLRFSAWAAKIGQYQTVRNPKVTTHRCRGFNSSTIPAINASVVRRQVRKLFIERRIEAKWRCVDPIANGPRPNSLFSWVFTGNFSNSHKKHSGPSIFLPILIGLVTISALHLTGNLLPPAGRLLINKHQFRKFSYPLSATNRQKSGNACRRFASPRRSPSQWPIPAVGRRPGSGRTWLPGFGVGPPRWLTPPASAKS